VWYKIQINPLIYSQNSQSLKFMHPEHINKIYLYEIDLIILHALFDSINNTYDVSIPIFDATLWVSSSII